MIDRLKFFSFFILIYLQSNLYYVILSYSN